MQIDIFDLMYQPLRINNKIRIIEFFGGYGSQLLALKYLGANVEQWKLCEWAVKSIQAYKDIHFENDNTDYSKELTIEEVKQYLYDKGISQNYNEPMSKEQVWRLNEEQVRTIYNNIKSTHNLVDIQQVKGNDLDIVDKDKYTYLLTYSFPCQDLSLAGKQKGMSDTSTRSGMLWEVERILKECDNKPQILLMENVPQVHSTDNLKDFQKWITSLEEMGYKNYYQDLIATDYGIPQTRNRTFMVSVLGDYKYTFPEPIPLKLKLKDMLEDNVDEKYYLSDKLINFFTHNEEKQKENGNGFRFNVSDGDVIAKTITTSAGNRMDDNYIIGKIENWHQRGNVYGENNSAPTICATNYKTPKLIATTISTNVENRPVDNFITIPKVLGGIGEKDSNNNTQWKQQNRVYDGNVSISITTAFNPYYKNDLRIRKLTPKECFRLMGVKDEDYEKVKKHQSNASAYHLAGDSICIPVLMAIFGEMLGIDWKSKIKELEKDYE